MKNYYLAIDIGASAGRHIVGWTDEGKTETEEVFRFPNELKKQCGHLVWNIESLFKYVLKGIKRAFKKYPFIRSLAIDAWGCDYVLLCGNDMFGPCLSYRDERPAAVREEVHARLPFRKLYMRTGIQFQPFNTVYQLYEDKKRGRLSLATDFLMIPEYLAYRLTGVKRKEYTNATTTGLVNIKTGQFDGEIVRALDLSEKFFPRLHRPGERVGMLLPQIAAAVGGQTEVVLCATHDTASAVEGIAMDGEAPYIFSGTWSLLGVKSNRALTDETSRKANYSNEGGLGYICYQKNIAGMWIIDNLKKELCPDMSLDEIIREARESKYDGVADINASQFLSPERMTEAFDVSVKQVPKTKADYFKCAFLSLAEHYKTAIAQLEANVGKTYQTLYIVGEGAKNAYLNELTESGTGKQIIARPIEAAAMGNLKIQMRRDA